MVETAVKLGASGLRVFPCRPDDKRPLVKWSTHASSHAAAIRSMFIQHPDALIGLCTGNGVVVVDVDPRHGGKVDPAWPTTKTVATRGGGWHLYYRTKTYVPCSVGRVAEGVDIRGDGGYVIAPGSPGWEYVNVAAPVVELPQSLLAAATSTSLTPGSGQRFVERDVVDEGGRNDYIARYVGWLLRQEVDDVVQLALDHNAEVCVPPLDEDEVRRTANSIIRRHNANA